MVITAVLSLLVWLSIYFLFITIYYRHYAVVSSQVIYYMSTIHSPSAAKHASSFARTSRQAVATLFIGSVVMLGLSGCGQKGDLYLADSSSQTIEGSASVLDSTSHPQDAAFAGIDDDNYQKNRYLEEQMVLPEPSTDPNDY